MQSIRETPFSEPLISSRPIWLFSYDRTSSPVLLRLLRLPHIIAISTLSASFLYGVYLTTKMLFEKGDGEFIASTVLGFVTQEGESFP